MAAYGDRRRIGGSSAARTWTAGSPGAGDQALVGHDDVGRAQVVPARDGGPLGLRLLGGVVGDARRPGQGDADRPAEHEERTAVIAAPAEVAGDAHRREAQVRDLAWTERQRRALAGQRRACGRRRSPLVGAQVALVGRAPHRRAHPP
jgi:hypothetical protein